jgi:hypothetical protein
MSENKSAITRFTVEALPNAAGQVEALRERLQRADAKPIDYSDIPELADEWFLRAAREGSLAKPPAKKPISTQLDEDVPDTIRNWEQDKRCPTGAAKVLRLQALCLLKF